MASVFYGCRVALVNQLPGVDDGDGEGFLAEKASEARDDGIGKQVEIGFGRKKSLERGKSTPWEEGSYRKEDVGARVQENRGEI